MLIYFGSVLLYSKTQKLATKQPSQVSYLFFTFMLSKIKWKVYFMSYGIKKKLRIWFWFIK